MRYRTIVADPPWHYEEWPAGSLQGRAAQVAVRRGEGFRNRPKKIDYPTLTTAQIAALPVVDLAETDAHLWLWTTNRYLPHAFEIAATWGFRYSQTLVWAKTPMGLGPGGAFANNAEYILFCRRGSLKHNERCDSVWFNWRRAGNGQHSRKPDAFLDLVERISPGPYVELFSRRQRLGWDYRWHDLDPAPIAPSPAVRPIRSRG